MNISKLARTATALVAGATLFAAVSAGAFAVPPNTFTVSTTITASCSVTDAGPANLTPTYTPTTDTGVGSATTLDTFCTGTTPTVVLSDAAGSGGPEFVMTDGGANLYYHLANGTSCNGTNTDNVIDEGTTVNLTSGEGVLNICAAVIAGGGLNVDAAAGSYLDTVTYTITP